MAILPILKVIITIVRYFTLPLRENSLFYSPLAGELFILLSPCGRVGKARIANPQPSREGFSYNIF
jgi:hypothetical protein